MTIVGEALVTVSPTGAGFASKLGSIMSNPIAGLTLAAVGAGVALLDIGTKFQGSYNAIARGTGATGDQLNKLKGDFKNVLGGTAGSFQQVQDAIIGLSRATGLTGPALDTFAKQEVTLARITKTDVAANIAATEPLFAKYGIAAKSQGAALDVLFKASQQSGLSVADLADKMKSGGVVLQAFGYSFNQSAALIAAFTKAGVNSDQAIAGMKKGFASFAKAGEDPQKAMSALIAKIKEAPTAAEATGLAFKTFGARAGPELVAAIRSGRLSIDEMTKIISSGKDGIMATANATPTLAGAFAKLKNQVLVALEPIATKLLGLATIVVGKLFPVFRSIIAVIQPVFEAIQAIIGKAWDAIMGGFENPTAKNSVKGWIGTFISFGQEAKRIFESVQAAISPVVDVVKLFFDVFNQGPGAMDGATAATARFGGPIIALSKILHSVVDFLEAHWKPILIGLGIAVFGVAGALVYLYVKFQVVRDVVAAVVDAIGSFVSFMSTALAPLVQTFSSRFGEIVSIVKVAVELVAIPIYVTFKAIQAFWEVFHATILRVLMAVWDEIKLVVTVAVRIVADIIKLALDLLTGHWSKAWNDLLDILRSVWDLIIGTVRNALSIVGNIIASLAGIFGRAMAAAAGAVVSGGVAVLKWFFELPGNINHILVNLAVDLFNLGVHIIEGLINGIGSMAQAVTNKITSVVTGPVNAVKHFFGINSPSTLFHGFGVNLMQGFANGIGAGAGLPQDAMRKLNLGAFTPNMPIPGSGGASTAQAATGGQPGSVGGNQGGGPQVSVVQHIYPSPGMSEIMVGRTAAAEISWANRPLRTGGR